MNPRFDIHSGGSAPSHLVWSPLNRPDLAVFNEISDAVRVEEWSRPDLLTSVRRGPTLVMTCDYGGAHKGSRYETLAFLIADLAFVWLWDDFRTRIRRQHLGDGRRLSYKGLSDRWRAQAVVPFLRASNTIPGLLVVFAVSKTCLHLLSEPLPARDASEVPLGAWKTAPFERLSRIGLLGATLLSCMSGPHQNVLWVTDQDEIAPNVPKLTEASAVVAHYIAHICRHPLGHIRFGTTASDDGTLQLEDLAALADLGAGAVSDVLSRFKDSFGRAAGPVLCSLPRDLPRKAQMLTGWLAEQWHPLRKLIIVVDDVGDSMHRTSVVRMGIDRPIPEFDWRTEVSEYLANKIVFRAAL